jgi:hypothetical protein
MAVPRLLREFKNAAHVAMYLILAFYLRAEWETRFGPLFLESTDLSVLVFP